MWDKRPVPPRQSANPLPRPEILTEVRRLLLEAGITQYQLRAAGISAETARRLLGLRDGSPAVEAVDAALRLVGRRLWHDEAPALHADRG